MRVGVVEPDGRRINSPAIEIHVTEIDFRAQDKPIPLEVITRLSAGDDPRLAVTKWVIDSIVTKVKILTVPELPANVQTDIKTGPITLRRRGWCDLFHFFTTVSFGSGKRRHHCGAGTK